MRVRFDSPQAIGFGSSPTPAVRMLLIVNAGIFLFQMLAAMVAQVRLERVFGLVPHDVTHQLFLWQLGTYLFLHGGLFHILFNMLALWMFGTELELLWGTRRFTQFYFVTGVGAGVCSTLVSPGSYVPIIGASGAIYGLLAAYGLLFPDRLIYLYFLIPIRAKYFVLILGFITFYMSITQSGSGIAHIAHLGGLLFGWLYLRGWPRRGGSVASIREWFERRREKRLRKKFRVYYQKTRGEDEDGER